MSQSTIAIKMLSDNRFQNPMPQNIKHLFTRYAVVIVCGG